MEDNVLHALVQAIMQLMGFELIAFSLIIITAFLVWVVQIEFEWFFGLNIWTRLHDRATAAKYKVAGWLAKGKIKVDIANEGPKKKKHMRLLEGKKHETETL